MRRIITVLAVMAIMAAMVAVMAAPAFAYANHDTGSGSGKGQDKAQEKNVDVVVKQLEKGVAAGGGPKGGFTSPTNSDHYWQNKIDDAIGNQ